MILLFHEGTDSKISTPARLGRELHPPRHYQAEGHILVLDGPGHIIAHDAEEICKIPGYRMATPQEQDVYHGRMRQSSALHEAAVPIDAGDAAGTEDPTEDETSTPESVESEQASNTTAPTRGKRRK